MPKAFMVCKRRYAHPSLDEDGREEEGAETKRRRKEEKRALQDVHQVTVSPHPGTGRHHAACVTDSTKETEAEDLSLRKKYDVVISANTGRSTPPLLSPEYATQTNDIGKTTTTQIRDVVKRNALREDCSPSGAKHSLCQKDPRTNKALAASLSHIKTSFETLNVRSGFGLPTRPPTSIFTACLDDPGKCMSSLTLSTSTSVVSPAISTSAPREKLVPAGSMNFSSATQNTNNSFANLTVHTYHRTFTSPKPSTVLADLKFTTAMASPRVTASCVSSAVASAVRSPCLSRTSPGNLPSSYNQGLTSPHSAMLPERPMTFLQTPIPLPLREHYHPGNNGHYVSFPPSLARPIPTFGMPWGLRDGVFHPVPLRIPMGLRADFCPPGVVAPEEVPSPPGSVIADMPGSSLLGLRSPGHDLGGSFGEPGRLVDLNNNSPAGNVHRHCEDAFKGDQSKQSFKTFLESAKVRVETINDGNGLKNPLLSPDKARLNLDTGPLGFMTLEPFPSCPVCEVKCDTPKLLQRHVRSHKEIKRYLCAYCGKGFNDTFDLKRHTRTHTGVRPYKCDECGKAFTQRCSLESHSRKIHGQNLPFTFNERRTKIYVCEDCGHSTSNLDAHFRHLRAQHPGHPALLKHHDRRQFKFCKDGEYVEEGEEEGNGEEGEEVDVGEEERRYEEKIADGGKEYRDER